MNKDAIKEALHNHRLNKTIFWNTFLVLTAGNIGLAFRLVSSRGLLEMVLAIIGIILWFSLIFLIIRANEEINRLWLVLKEYKD